LGYSTVLKIHTLIVGILNSTQDTYINSWDIQQYARYIH